MKVYHYVSAEHGLTNITRRHIKVSCLDDLNDPFEMLPSVVNTLSAPTAFHKVKNTLGEKRGILCFSGTWQNAVQWSHYACRHKGVCLGFDIPDIALRRVTYTHSRPQFDGAKFAKWSGSEKEGWMADLLHTKFCHWEYEEELRMWVDLSECCVERTPSARLVFRNFSDDLILKEVLLGADCKLTLEEVIEALGQMKRDVEISRVRLSDSAFRIER